MPTYRIRFIQEEQNIPDLVVEAAQFEIADAVLKLRSNDDRRIVALVPLDRLLYVKEDKND